ncbi:MAG: CarD family transcriptional regulator [Holosporales bacterium]|jgi:CarD family transcriptional regulator|nr:CarD family transcriptional regulator [Holosporales bacterium]
MVEKKRFKVGEFVVYPAHGVGKLIDIEEHEVGNTKIDLYVIDFDKDHMVLRLPVDKANSAGLRGISGRDEMLAALKMLSVKTKKKKAMWSRRAQEYEAKINSGSVGGLADVIRELYTYQVSGEQSYSERQIYQTAMERFVRELSLVENIDEEAASSRIHSFLEVA